MNNRRQQIIKSTKLLFILLKLGSKSSECVSQVPEIYNQLCPNRGRNLNSTRDKRKVSFPVSTLTTVRVYLQPVTVTVSLSFPPSVREEASHRQATCQSLRCHGNRSPQEPIGR